MAGARKTHDAILFVSLYHKLEKYILLLEHHNSRTGNAQHTCVHTNRSESVSRDDGAAPTIRLGWRTKYAAEVDENLESGGVRACTAVRFRL